MADFAAITERQQKAWATGDFGRLGVLVHLHNELLAESLDLHPGEQVLDVASGNGGCAIASARRFCEVTSTDFVPDLLEQAARRAESEGLAMKTQLADAQDLPFEDESFDVVTSTFGAMFAPDQQKVADELLRVCRSGGRIGMANWVPDSVIGEVFRLTGQFVPPPPGIAAASGWGTRERLEELFGDAIAKLELVDRFLVFRFPSPAFMLEYMRTWYGPTQTAFNALDDERGEEYGRALLEIYEKYNRADDGTLIAPSAYVEVIATKR